MRAPRRPRDVLQTLPGVGPSIAADLHALGVHDLAAVAASDPQDLYDRLCVLTGARQDPCVLYVFRCAVYVARTPDPEPGLARWWNWKGRVP